MRPGFSLVACPVERKKFVVGKDKQPRKGKESSKQTAEFPKMAGGPARRATALVEENYAVARR